MKLKFKNKEILVCTYCSSPRLHMIGDVLICIDCKNARAMR